jgi:antitoxin component of MazEF toxin-antitoxin module
MQAQYPITVQAIRSKGQKTRLYVYVPLPLAAAIGLEPGEEVQWTLLDRDTLQVKRYRRTTVKTARPSPKRKAKRT